MIKGKIYQRDDSKDLTYANILSKITDFDIFMFFTPHKWSLNQSFHSPFRKDPNPSFQIKISKTSGTIYWLDYATGDTGNSIQYVQKLYDINYNEALKRINEYFQLGLGSNKKIEDPVYKSFTKKYEQPIEIKSYRRIDVWTKKFSLEELAYWKRFNITLEELKKFNIYSISEYRIDGIKQVLDPLTFAYYYPKKDKWKIYKPLVEKKKKWKSNVPFDTLEGLETLKKDKICIGTKSRKDRVVISKFIPECFATQSESEISITEENIDYIKKNCRECYLWWDSDDRGVEACKYYNQFGFKYINIPKELKAKDPAEFVEKYGLEKFKKFLKEKKLI